MEKPYLSIIATTRNDNHGGDLLKRTTCFVEGIYHQAKTHKVPVELLIVEWNPPQGKELLKEVLPKPPEGCPVSLRFIIVPEEIHKQYSMAERMPLFQMTAKNVGIRRAKGDFILCTNIDLLFSGNLFKFLAEKNLQKGEFYRANRVDVPAKIMDIDNFDEKIRFGKSNIINVLGFNSETIFMPPRTPEWLFSSRYLYLFLNFIFKQLAYLIYPKLNIRMFKLDTGACGDFTLMHKDDWVKIEGYPELDLYSIHIDSMALLAAEAAELKQVILPPNMCSFHIYHENGWESFKESPIDLIRFIEKRPGLDWHSVYDTGKWMIKNKKLWGLNKSDWGFTKKTFKEYIFEAEKEA